MNAAIHSLFTIPIGEIELEEGLDYSVEEIEILCQQERKKDSKGVIKSNLGGWQSDNIIYPDSPFFFLSNIEEICQKFFKEVLMFNESIHMINAWININPKYTSNNVHTHPESALSGVYYIKTPEECGDIIFYHPSNELMQRDWSVCRYSKKQFLASNSPRWAITPKKGVLYIFPSWLGHCVDSNKSEEERISISFNLG